MTRTITYWKNSSFTLKSDKV